MTETKQVAIVTGASRGAGRGIAIALGAAGFTVYVTGRTMKEGQAALPGTIFETADAVTAAGGLGIPVRCDHGNDTDIKDLLEKVEAEQGRLDILVNNVAHIDDSLIEPGGFWEKPLTQSNILTVGLRSQYVASWYAAPIMVRQNKGLIVFTSSFGSVCYMHGAAYGAQKAGVDKFAADMAIDLKEHNVAAVSIWMGMLMTERSKKAIAEHPEIYGKLAEMAETPEFTGHLVNALFTDPELMTLTGQTLIGAELADRYDLLDAGGKKPLSHRPFLGDPRIPHPAIVR
jgi:NAD(P)-dependent dehydrogenase (short-subunit alcohol dehydrogenase family)